VAGDPAPKTLDPFSILHPCASARLEGPENFVGARVYLFEQYHAKVILSCGRFDTRQVDSSAVIICSPYMKAISTVRSGAPCVSIFYRVAFSPVRFAATRVERKLEC
jgi:hypothetical protein